jgi:hypothetical protein
MRNKNTVSFSFRSSSGIVLHVHSEGELLALSEKQAGTSKLYPSCTASHFNNGVFTIFMHENDPQ